MYVLCVVVLQVLAWLQEGNDVRLGDWTAREIEILNTWMLLTGKPVVYLVNMSAKVSDMRLTTAMVRCRTSATVQREVCTQPHTLFEGSASRCWLWSS